MATLIDKKKLLLYVKQALKDKTIRIIDAPKESGCVGICCAIYGMYPDTCYFYFDGNADNYETAEEYLANTIPTKQAETITQAIYDCHKDLDFDDSFGHAPQDGEFYSYYLYLKRRYEKVA